VVSAFLYRHRDRLVVAWCAGCALATWPPVGWVRSWPLLVAGLALRIWARAHIGPHSRGRNLSAPERCVGGPYRWIGHPLYLANLLVAAALGLALSGPAPAAALFLAGPAALYAALARAESARLRLEAPPPRSQALPWNLRRMRSEWASLVPPVLAWTLLLWVARR